jgi:hypothetical protein
MYAFIGLERQSAVLVYDITNPAAPVYQRYLSNRDFSVSNNDIAITANAAGDLGPEGLKFISAADSPDGTPYLITGNEISGTVTAWALTSDIMEEVDVFGCMYPDALNYNSEATVDDLSCEFELASNCPADLTQDGVVNTQDLLEFLVSFGSFCE